MLNERIKYMTPESAKYLTSGIAGITTSADEPSYLHLSYATQICESCGQHVEDSFAIYCPYCGKSLMKKI